MAATLLFAAADAAFADSGPSEASDAPVVARSRWSPGPLRVGYVLRPATLEPDRKAFLSLVQSTDRNLWILDASYDVDQPSRWTFAEISAAHANDPSRKVLALLSVSTVDRGREYYDDVTAEPAPLVIGQRVTVPGATLRVKWWEPAWKDLLLESVDALLARGFDGVVLSGVDAFSEGEVQGDRFKPNAVNPATKRTFRADMAALVRKVAEYGRAGGQGAFLTFARGGVELFGQPGYGAAIDGVVVEGLFSNAARDVWMGNFLEPFALSGGVVVVVEDQTDDTARARAGADTHGWTVLFNSPDRSNLGAVR